MKVRSGFVSNSSSSSYVLILKEEDYQKLAVKHGKLIEAIVKDFGSKVKKFADLQVRIISWMAGNYSSFENLSLDKSLLEEARRNTDEVFDYDGDLIYCTWDSFVDDASKLGIKVVNDC